MKIYFSQFYVEPGAAFDDLTNAPLRELKNSLDALSRTLSHYEKLFKTNDFSIEFILSATSQSNNLIVKGPTTLSKDKTVEFVLYIPYKEITLFVDSMHYILDFICEGVCFVFKKYKTDTSGVHESIQHIKDMISNDPEKYKIWIRQKQT